MHLSHSLVDVGVVE